MHPVGTLSDVQRYTNFVTDIVYGALVGYGRYHARFPILTSHLGNYDVLGVLIREHLATSAEEIIKIVCKWKGQVDMGHLQTEANRVMKLVRATEANGGYRPLPREYEKLGLTEEDVR